MASLFLCAKNSVFCSDGDFLDKDRTDPIQLNPSCSCFLLFFCGDAFQKALSFQSESGWNLSDTWTECGLISDISELDGCRQRGRLGSATRSQELHAWRGSMIGITIRPTHAGIEGRGSVMRTCPVTDADPLREQYIIEDIKTFIDGAKKQYP